MKVAHIADVHLGYRAYNRVTEEGINQREEDVFNAFTGLLKSLSSQQPDLVIIAGDLFHTVRPSNRIIYKTFRLLDRYQQRHKTPLVIIGGNHDTPKSSDTGCILDLLALLPNTHVRHHGYGEAIHLPDLDTNVYCLPYFGLFDLWTQEESRPVLRPGEDGVRNNILALHGTVEGIIKSVHDPVQLAPEDLHYKDWDYVAVGHYHIRTQLAENAFYAGAVEFTSSNIWEESTAQPKGAVIFDTEARTHSVIETPDVRYVRQINIRKAANLSADQLISEIDAQMSRETNRLSEKIIRVVVEGFPRQLQKDLDWKKLREYRNQALHFDFVLRPEAQTASPDQPHVLTGGRTLEEEWDDFVLGMPDVPRVIDRQVARELGKAYLAQTSTSLEDG